jgi:hypothetical protein
MTETHFDVWIAEAFPDLPALSDARDLEQGPHPVQVLQSQEKRPQGRAGAGSEEALSGAGAGPLILWHVWSRVRRFPKRRWRCRRCGRLFLIRTHWACATQLGLPFSDSELAGL